MAKNLSFGILFSEKTMNKPERKVCVCIRTSITHLVCILMGKWKVLKICECWIVMKWKNQLSGIFCCTRSHFFYLKKSYTTPTKQTNKQTKTRQNKHDPPPEKCFTKNCKTCLWEDFSSEFESFTSYILLFRRYSLELQHFHVIIAFLRRETLYQFWNKNER